MLGCLQDFASDTKAQEREYNEVCTRVWLPAVGLGLLSGVRHGVTLRVVVPTRVSSSLPCSACRRLGHHDYK
jgi:hypothetical protein